MALNPLTPGLRVFNKSNSTQRIELLVQVGDELEVSPDVAAQLPASFAPVDDNPVPVAEQPAKKAKK